MQIYTKNESSATFSLFGKTLRMRLIQSWWLNMQVAGGSGYALSNFIKAQTAHWQ